MESRGAVDALPYLEAAGIERVAELQQLSAYDLAALGLDDGQRAQILGVADEASAWQQSVDLAAQHAAPQAEVPRSEFYNALESANMQDAEPYLVDVGISCLADLQQLNAADIDGLNLPGDVGARLKIALGMPTEPAPAEEPPTVLRALSRKVSGWFGSVVEAMSPRGDTDIQAGAGALVSAELGGPAAVADSSADVDAPPPLLASESSDMEMLLSDFERQSLRHKGSFINEDE